MCNNCLVDKVNVHDNIVSVNPSYSAKQSMGTLVKSEDQDEISSTLPFFFFLKINMEKFISLTRFKSYQSPLRTGNP